MLALTPYWIALLGAIVPCLATFLPTDDETLLSMLNGAPMIPSKRVPGDSPAFYVGDPSNDILVIHSLDLMPNPPIKEFTVLLTGHLTADIGAGAFYKLTAFLNGTVGPSGENDLFDEEDNLEMWQCGELVRDRLMQGPVVVSFSARIMPPWMDKGYYKVQTGMWAGAGKRMAGFEGTVWVQGENEGSGWDELSAYKEL